MNDINQLFFELIRVAIGTHDRLSKVPSADEWGELYAMAKKQSLVGICFAGVQKTIINHPSLIVNLSESLRLQWMGMAARIQQRNEVMNRQCVELQKLLTKAGMRSAILKGQGVASLYKVSEFQVSSSKDLSMLRQSGDIDVYVDCGRVKAIEYARSIQDEVDWDYKHLHLKLFKDTEVEVHYRPEVFLNVLKNKKLQQYFHQEYMQNNLYTKNGDMITPGVDFNLSYLLLHMYKHMFDEGVGLRQLMDYYFLLNRAFEDETDHVVCECRRSNLRDFIEQFGMKRFAEGVMYIMQDVFRLSMLRMPVCPNRKQGEWLLNEVMQSGNFGKQDLRYGKAQNKFDKAIQIVRRSLGLFAHYPSDSVAVPFYYAWHWCWKRLN